MNMFFLTAFNVILGIDVGWKTITDSIGRLFWGGNYTDAYGIVQNVSGIFPENPMQADLLAGMIILMFFLLLTAIFGMGMLIGSVIIIPALFAIFQYIPSFRVIIAILAGIIFGLAIHKFIKR